MKKTAFLCVALLAIAFAGFAQRYAIVDTRYILEKIPEYKEANQKLEQTADIWQKEIDIKQSDLDKMYRELDAERVMLSPELLKKREDEIFNKEKEVREMQRRRFGYEGDYFRKKQELVKPIQDKVYTAIQKMATERMFDFVLDKSEGITVIFADPKLDRSDDILKMLGLKL